MTRTKEVDPDSNEIPDYKSPASRLVHSLRKGYNNLRGKVEDFRKEIKYYQIKTRDLEKSREKHKEEKIVLKKKISELEIALTKFEKENEKLRQEIQKHEKKSRISYPG